MNTRITLSAAFAVGVLFALAPAQAQAPGNQKSQMKIKAMQSRINALQAQVKQLQQQLGQARSLAARPSPFTGPAYQMPDFNMPGMYNYQSSVTLPTPQKPLVIPHAPRLYNIPDCQITFIKQTSR